MDLTLKNIKYFKPGSEETPNFVASLYDNGKHVATVANDGHGGCNYFQPVNGGSYSSVMKYDNYNVEAEIFRMVYEYDAVTTHQTKSLVMKKGDSLHLCKFNISIARLKRSPKNKALLEEHIKDYEKKGFTILNRNI